MMLDYNSLLLALGVSAACLAVTLMGSWLVRRSETVLLTATVGLVLVVSGIFVYSAYVNTPEKWLGVANFVLFHAGFATIWGAGKQFLTGRVSLLAIAIRALAAMVFSVVPMLSGYDGLAFIADNLAIALLLFATARQYWLARAEAPAPLLGIAVLYTLTAISFFLCAAVLISDGKLVLGKAPSNWAEDLSLAVCIAGMTGIGALSLALHQWRLAARHRLDAITDPLTGLLNRRALFDQYGTRPMGTTTAVIVFDIDHFKSVNDRFGHAAGDRVLNVFSGELSAHCRTGDTAARLGGEEFVLVLREIMPGRAELTAERIRRAFEAREIHIDDEVLTCTVSVGVAPGRSKSLDFDTMLSAADKALYVAKRAGRNRVELASYLKAVPVEAARTAS
ncbi:GGDEF domain-containing protein [Rhizobium ruizarguesonis]|jgi:diguanylate cyclase (GGDEF)-like protein|uniref:GGDEF domain-containing protein n=1 Tax=Rhizobium ruizarguesonis TaxID=2081791 RepID=UPI00102FC06A|nr:GGDEF domain-containing protein [Rhizobium ruizarguesonis]MBY5891078.1 GGDEF domain-containing protein [Rhizobium leguminosarum]NKL45696.1 diguanylate cyclase [Rhizobium leguminosarum bv. viciae]NKQ74119.1 GGDEF domain-containing protein [Rhizobium ruizarguesonis]QSZ01467.1 GGDEF domain-containing protein [Rhizobium ruizarguesonis]TAY77595.1 GGDEF domain-containing protein [Rhizobium ruizarguesonis]